jgi:hypothetical protein
MTVRIVCMCVYVRACMHVLVITCVCVCVNMCGAVRFRHFFGDISRHCVKRCLPERIDLDFLAASEPPSAHHSATPGGNETQPARTRQEVQAERAATAEKRGKHVKPEVRDDSVVRCSTSMCCVCL